MLYNAILLPHINYCLVNWGYQCKRINILQKRAVRLITLSKYNSHTAPLFKKLTLLTIKDRQALQELRFYYKLTHNELPDYFQNWQIVTNSELHWHNTRRKHDIHIVGFRHILAKRCIRINLPRHQYSRTYICTHDQEHRKTSNTDRCTDKHTQTDKYQYIDIIVIQCTSIFQTCRLTGK